LLGKCFAPQQWNHLACFPYASTSETSLFAVAASPRSSAVGQCNKTQPPPHSRGAAAATPETVVARSRNRIRRDSPAQDMNPQPRFPSLTSLRQPVPHPRALTSTPRPKVETPARHRTQGRATRPRITKSSIQTARDKPDAAASRPISSCMDWTGNCPSALEPPLSRANTMLRRDRPLELIRWTWQVRIWH